MGLSTSIQSGARPEASSRDVLLLATNSEIIGSALEETTSNSNEKKTGITGCMGQRSQNFRGERRLGEKLEARGEN